MDTKVTAEMRERADKQIALIKERLPGVYQAIKDKAGEIGNDAYALVRRGAWGEANCFYAFEAGRVVGTPFAQRVPAEQAALMVEFGATFLCMWASSARKDGDGAH